MTDLASHPSSPSRKSTSTDPPPLFPTPPSSRRPPLMPSPARYSKPSPTTDKLISTLPTDYILNSEQPQSDATTTRFSNSYLDSSLAEQILDPIPTTPTTTPPTSHHLNPSISTIPTSSAPRRHQHRVRFEQPSSNDENDLNNHLQFSSDDDALILKPEPKPNPKYRASDTAYDQPSPIIYANGNDDSDGIFDDDDDDDDDDNDDDDDDSDNDSEINDNNDNDNIEHENVKNNHDDGDQDHGRNDNNVKYTVSSDGDNYQTIQQSGQHNRKESMYEDVNGDVYNQIEHNVAPSNDSSVNPDITLASSLHPVSSPLYPDSLLYEKRSDSQKLRRRSLNYIRFSDAARAAKQKFDRRWSFHRRLPTLDDRPPSHSPSTASEPTRQMRQRTTTPLPNDDFLSPAFTSVRTPPSTDPSPYTQQSQPFTASRSETIEIPVKSWVLQGNGTAPRKNSRFLAWSKKLGPSKIVSVECNTSGLAPMVLYASDQVLTATRIEPFKATESITSRPEYVDKQSIVYRDSAFEIGVVGMSISGQEFKLGYPDYNEVLMYSMHRDPGEQGEEGDAMPYVHYDPTQDDKLRRAEPDQFIAVPASKSLFLASNGGSDVKSGMRKSVNCRFKVLELEAVDEMMQMSLAGIEQLGHHVQQYSAAAPALGLLTPAVSLASMVSKRALESHARPDRVIMIDMNFLLAERRQGEQADGERELPFESRSGEYLRYGYYFFLERGVEAKLYASFRTFPNISLMMKRVDRPGPNEKQFFPLTGVSYLVIRVTPRLSSVRETRKPIHLRHVRKLEQLMKSALRYSLRPSNNDDENAMSIVRMLSELGEELGIAHRDMDNGRRLENEIVATTTKSGAIGAPVLDSDEVDERLMARSSAGSRRFTEMSPMAEALGLSAASEWPSAGNNRFHRFPRLPSRSRLSSRQTSDRSSSPSTAEGGFGQRHVFPQYSRLSTVGRPNRTRISSSTVGSTFQKS